jgi:hypothetical protein
MLGQPVQHVTCKTALVSLVVLVGTPIASAVGRTTRSTLRRRASCPTCFITGNAPAAPVPITSRRHRHGMSSRNRQRGVPVRAAELPGRGLRAHGRRLGRPERQVLPAAPCVFDRSGADVDQLPGDAGLCEVDGAATGPRREACGVHRWFYVCAITMDRPRYVLTSRLRPHRSARSSRACALA